MLFMPVVIAFFESNNLSFNDVMKLQAIHAFSMVLFEIPSGYFSDKIGRKNTLIIGCILGFIGFSCFTQSSLFWHFMIANMFIGLVDSFISGTDSAMLYDTLFELGKESDYLKFEGRTISLGSLAEAVAAIIGGLIAMEYELRATYYAQAFLSFVAVLTAFSLVEPQKYKENTVPSIKNTLNVMFYSLFKHKILSWCIILSSIIGVATLLMAWFAQHYFTYLGIAVKYNLYIWAALNIMVAVVSWYAWKIEHNWGKKQTLFLISFGVGALFMVMAPFQHWLAIILLFLFYGLRGLATPVLRDYIQRSCPAELRATIMSIRSFIIRISFILFSLFMGWMVQNSTITITLLGCGFIVISLSLISVWKLKVNGFLNNN